MPRIFKTRYFSRWMRKTKLMDKVLCAAVSEMEAGLIDADMGGSIVKKRVALPGRGKSGGTRTLVATNKDDRWTFVFGFEKSERARELEALQDIAIDLLGLDSNQLDAHVRNGALQEICHDNQD